MFPFFKNTHSDIYERHLPLYLLLLLATTACAQTANKPIQDETQTNISITSTIESNTPGTPTSKMLSLPPDIMSNQPYDSINPLQNFKGIKGIKVDQLFSEKLNNPEKRVDRLEDVVTNLYQDLETMKPSLIRLIAIEGDIKQLVTMLSDEASPPEDSPQFIEDDSPEMSPAPVSTIAQPSKPEQKNLLNIRIGEHNNFTRIVLDSAIKVEVDAALDENKETLLIMFPRTQHSNIKEISIPSGSLIKTCTSENNGDDKKTILNVLLIQEVQKIKKMSYYDNDTSLFKVIIDIHKNG